MASRDKYRRLAVMAILIAVGTALWVLEEFIPRPLPWAKPGLANIATIVAIVLLGPRDGLFVAVGRVLLGALLLGRFGSAGFLMSLSGAISAAALMGLIWKTRAPFSLYGISLFGALAHGVAQLVTAVYLVYTPFAFVYILPWVSLPALATGLLVGFLSSLLLRRLPDNYMIRVV